MAAPTTSSEAAAPIGSAASAPVDARVLLVEAELEAELVDVGDGLGAMAHCAYNVTAEPKAYCAPSA